MLKALNSRAMYLAVGSRLILAAALLFYPCSRLVAAENSNSQNPPQDDPGGQARSADALLEAGNTRYIAGDLGNAEKNWIEVRRSARKSPAWPKAVYNLGLLEMNQANYPKAIGYFNEVLQSHPDDKEPGGSIMQVSRNYSNRSAFQVDGPVSGYWLSNESPLTAVTPFALGWDARHCGAVSSTRSWRL
jgi:tetratricopeptide (TPR) repeat protein